MPNKGLEQILPEMPSASAPDAVLDIIFIHGLGGDRHGTWQKSEETFWPRWLTEKFPECRVYTYGYDSEKFAGVLTGEGASIQDLALAMADGIASRESRADHLLLVAHSLGGLIVKQMIRRCAESEDVDFKTIGRSIAGLGFLATPHQGSHAAKSLDFLLKNFKSKQAKQLAYSDENLIDLHEFFRSWVARQKPSVRSYYETEQMLGFLVVDRVTANPGILGSEPIAVQSNHIDICKPANKDAPVYVSICALVRKVLSHLSSQSNAGTHHDQAISPTGNGAIPTDHACSPTTIGETVPPDVLADFRYYTTMADDDRRDLEQKLNASGRSYAIRDAKRKKERFNMVLQRHIAQPAAVTRYTQLMADIETRFNRHVSRVIANLASPATIDQEIQDQVISPCTSTHSTSENEITSGLVDGALYYLAGNCHLAWDNG